MASAFMGQVPNNQQDYWIIKGIFRRLNDNISDPAKGLFILPSRPLNDRYGSRGPGLIVANSVCITLIVLVTGARLLLRALHRGLRWGWDDWMILVASLVVLAWFSISVGLEVYGGDGKHLWDVTYHEYNRFDRLTFVNTILYLPSATLIKISIVLFNRRITGLTSKIWRRINDGFLFILLSYMIAYMVWIGVRCPNLNLTLLQVGQAKNFKYCNPHIGLKIGLGMVVIDVCLGFCLLATPVVVLWKIRMSRIRKFRLFIVFAVGTISCVAALMIVITQYQIHDDFTWNILTLQIWIMVDLFTGVVVASLPVLSSQLPKSWVKFKSYTRSHGLSQSGHSGHRELTDPKPDLGLKRRGGGDDGMNTQTDLEYPGKLDDQVELLEVPSRPAVALTNDHLSPSAVSITGEGRWRKESLESAATPPLATKN